MPFFMTVFLALSVFLSNCVVVHTEDILGMRAEKHDTSSSTIQATFRQVVPLTSVTFPGNVINSRYVKNWFVLYCVPWFERCAELQTEYDNLASKVHQDRNDKSTVLSSDVRFAQVDCSKEKPLCNAMKVGTYPVVVHYRGSIESQWVGGYIDHNTKKFPLANWVNFRLQLATTSDGDRSQGSLLTAWRDIDEEARNLIGGLVCICVLVFSLTQCKDQFTQLAKLRVEEAKKPWEDIAAAPPVVASDGSAQLMAASSCSVDGTALAAGLIDLDAMLVTPAASEVAPLPAAPASLEL